MIEIIELTTAKNTFEIPSEEVLTLATRVKAQEAQKLLMKATKDKRKFNVSHKNSGARSSR